jgi:hypothetical protein
MGPIDYSVTAHYSVCAWLKTNVRDRRKWQTAIGNWATGQFIFRFALDSMRDPEFAEYSGATGATGDKGNKLAAGPPGSFEVGFWTHVCESISTGDGGKKQMWVDGKLTGEISNEGAPAYAQKQGTFNMVIGDKSERGGNTWKGAIDDVMMWDFAITQEEVKAAFDRQPAAIPAPAAPQITRTRVGEFVGNDWRSVRNAIEACLGKFDTDPNCKINTWDMSKMEDLQLLAFDFKSFNEYIGDWDVSNVRNFDAAFAESGFNQDLSKWDMSRAEQVSNMFASCPFNQPIDMWNIRRVWNAYKMFHGNTAFNQDTSKLCDNRLAIGYSSKLFCKGGSAYV